MIKRIKGAILRLLASRDYVSFAEIEEELERLGIPHEGNCAISLTKQQNILIWMNMSHAFVKAVEQLIFVDRRVLPQEVPEAVYHYDGRVPLLPVATSLENAEEEECWLPVVFIKGNLVELTEQMAEKEGI